MADEVKRTFDLTDADYERSIGIMVLHQKASASFLQRTMSLGYNAAASLMERAEKDGFVSRAANSGKRNVLIGLPEIAKLRADLANAGAVMVEAALRLPAYDSDGDPAGQFDHHVFVRRDELRALSTLIPDMAAAIAERDVEIERLTARAEAAEAREAALLAANDVNRKLMLERNAEVDRWKKMADRLAEALKKTSDAHMSLAHDSYDGCWTIEDFDSKSAVATEALAAHAAMKEGR